MTLVKFSDGTESWGRLDGDGRMIVSRAASLRELADAEQCAIPLDSVELLRPLEAGAKVLCIGLNYRDHVAEMGREMPSHPVVFTRFADSLVGPGEPLVLPKASEKFDFEGEFAVVIGSECRGASAETALDHVLGYTILNDATLRDFQAHTHQFTPGKNFDRSGAIGPWIVGRDEFGEAAGRTIRTTLNGEIVQQSDLSQLCFDAAQLIEYISTWTTLRPGDVIATGTPGGVGAGRTPKLWMRVGDRCEIEIDGIGVLSNEVAAE